MAICPSCQAQIEIGSGFYGGLFTCPNCRSVYFIGFDGTPEAAQSHPSPAAEPPDYYSKQESASEVLSDYPQVPPGYDGVTPHLEQSPTPNQPHENNYDAPLGSDINNAMAPVDTPIHEPASQPNFSPLQDVVDFANSDSSTSIASYSVEITGLDSVQNIQLFKEVLTDSKLQMNFEQFKPRIINGRLKIEKLTAAQAAVITFRLRPLPLKMKWEQIL